MLISREDLSSGAGVTVLRSLLWHGASTVSVLNFRGCYLREFDSAMTLSMGCCASERKSRFACIPDALIGPQIYLIRDRNFPKIVFYLTLYIPASNIVRRAGGTTASGGRGRFRVVFYKILMRNHFKNLYEIASNPPLPPLRPTTCPVAGLPLSPSSQSHSAGLISIP